MKRSDVETRTGLPSHLRPTRAEDNSTAACCITGMHRSGTSMVARLLHACGLSLGSDENELNRPAPDNPEGYWENRAFVKLNEDILACLGGTWDAPPNFPIGWELTPMASPFLARAENMLDEFRRDHWGWKDPRSSLTLPFWLRAIPDLKLVICVRNPLEVARSLFLRGDSISPSEFRRWLTYYREILSATRRTQRLVTHYESYFQDARAELRRVSDWLDLKVSEEAVERACAHISAEFRHHYAMTAELIKADVPDEVLGLYWSLCAEAGPIYQQLREREKAGEPENTAAKSSEIKALMNELQELRSTHNEILNSKSFKLASWYWQSLRLEETRSRPVMRRLVPRALPLQIKDGLGRLKRRISSSVNSKNTLALKSLSDASSAVDFIPRKLAPLKLNVSPSAKRRVNVLMSNVNLQYFFAGSMCMFNLALQLSRRGHAVRVLIVDPSPYDPSRWRQEIAGYNGLRSFFDEVETTYVADRTDALDVSPADAFVATSWWTAHIAHQATRELEREKFIFLIQEYEPMFYPAGSLYALAAQAYTFPHHAIFSTEILRDYFEQERVGVFAPELSGDVPVSTTIRNAVNPYAVSEEEMRAHKRRKLLFYARPEQSNNARNVFELGILALRETLEEHHFDLMQWDFDGIGAMSHYRDIKLHRNADLHMLPGMSQPEFAKVLPTYDLGLSLMLTPHPSLMPIDMAAAGLVTVTTTFGNKTAGRMSEISRNIIAVPATIQALKTGLVAALREVEDFPKRVAGTRLNWSQSWEETFNESVMKQIEVYLG